MRLLVLGGSQFLGRAIAARACAAGLNVRALSETACDTLEWLRTANGPVVGLTSDEEREVLVAWHASGRAS